jgi:hypothetical protein
MMISTVVAVALGLTPVKESKSPQLVQLDDKVAAQIGRFQQFTGRDGRTHVRGFDRLGRAFDIAVDSKGHVDGQVGDWLVSFDASDPA